jgi:phage major head subunit gpT-like protein
MMTPQQFAELYEPKLREVFFEAYDELPEQYTDVFNVNPSKKATETDYHVASLGMWGKFTGAVEYEDYEPGKTVSYTHEMYAHGIQVPITAAEDDLYGVIGPAGEGTKRTKALARGARARVETLASDVLNNGFTNTGYDGKALFATDHPMVNGSTNSNKITDALSTTGIQNARLALRALTDDKGIKMQCVGNTLIVPVNLEYTAMELMQSDLKPGTPNNDKNVTGRMIKKLVVLDYLTDTNNWFLADSSRHQLNFFWRIKPEFKRDEDIDHFVLKFVGRMRFSVGYSDYRGIVGSLVA